MIRFRSAEITKMAVASECGPEIIDRLLIGDSVLVNESLIAWAEPRFADSYDAPTGKVEECGDMYWALHMADGSTVLVNDAPGFEAYLRVTRTDVD